MLGDEVLAAVRVVNHDARDAASLTWMGRFGADVPVWLNSEWVGGRRAHHDGLRRAALLRRILGRAQARRARAGGPRDDADAARRRAHRAPATRAGASPRATRCTTTCARSRPPRARTSRSTSCSTASSGSRRRSAASCSPCTRPPARSCGRRRCARCRAPSTSCSRPTPASRSTRTSTRRSRACRPRRRSCAPGGTIVCAAECRDGFPEHGSYREELTGAASPAALLEAIAAREQTVADQWQIQIQASIQARSRVIVHTSYLSDAELAEAHLEQTPDVEATVLGAARRSRARARACACCPTGR